MLRVSLTFAVAAAAVGAGDVAASFSAAVAGLRVSNLAPLHTAARQPHGAHVAWTLAGELAPGGRPVRVAAAELEVYPAVEAAATLTTTTSSALLRASRTFLVGAHEGGSVRLTSEELAALPASIPLAYRVRVRLEEESSAAATAWTPWSPAAPWLVGPGPRPVADWPGGAGWICTSPVGARDTRSSLLRADFILPAARGAISSAALHVVGVGQFRVSVNSVDLLGAEANAPGQSDWRKTIFYSTYSILPSVLVPAGANAIGATLGNGMYNVPTPANGRYTKWSGSFGPRALLAALVVTYADGSNFTFATGAGAAWLGTDGGPITFSHEYAGEDRDASLEVHGWDAPGFDPVTANPKVVWAPAQDCSAAAPTGALRPSAFDAVAVVAELPALTVVPSTAPGRVLVDVGKNFAGYPNVTILNVPAGTTVRVWPSETLEGGRIQQASGGTPVYAQYLTPPSPADGTYNVTVSPTFFTYGWRWLEVETLPTQPAPGGDVAAAGGNGTVTVLLASYGVSCNSALAGDATAAVSAFCDGSAACAYYVCVCGDNSCPNGAPPCLPDPAQDCAKDFSVVWRCTADAPGTNRTIYIPAEADNLLANVTCGPPPPAPVLPAVAAAAGAFVRASVRRVGTWTSSNAWVNRIHAITLEAIEANLQSVLTDCPHRERLGWLEVSHLMFVSIAYNFDISRVWGKIARDTVDSQLPSGLVPDIAPEYTVFSGGFRDSPEWGSAAVMNPAWLLQWYADVETTNATYATAQRYVDYLLQARNGAGLLAYGLGDWIPVEASPPGVTGTGTLVQDLTSLSVAASALGHPAEAANYSALAKAVAAAYEKAFFNASAAAAGGAAYPTQCAAGYALSLGFASNATAAREFLVRDVRSYGGGNVTTSGEVGNVYALRALADAPGGPDAVWASLQRTNSPGYGWMLTRGETALAESWTDAPGDSHIHAMYGHVDEYLYAHVAGIRQAPGGRGWRRVLFAPHPPAGDGEGAFVHATFDSPAGRIESRATVLARGGARLELTCPVGAACVAALPRSGRVVPVPATGRAHVILDVDGDVSAAS